MSNIWTLRHFLQKQCLSDTLLPAFQKATGHVVSCLLKCSQQINDKVAITEYRVQYIPSSINLISLYRDIGTSTQFLKFWDF